MCGINGIIDYSKSDYHFDLIKKLNKVLNHRGPDAQGIWKDKNIVLGHTRLSILDLSKNGSQPMKSKNSRFIITYNGEIYNYKILKKKLEKNGHQFQGTSDTEVILKYFEIYGIKCVNFFEGMFIFAIWDRSEECLYIARDRIGEKPCYYNFQNKKFIFSSEIKSLILAPWIKQEINKQSMADLALFASIPGQDTIYKNIKSVPPAHFLKFKNGKVELKKYWQLKFSTKKINIDDATEELFSLLNDKVYNVTNSDVPIGLTLSGGVDSSLVAAVLKYKKFDNFKSFCISGASDIEKKRATDVANLLNLDHINIDYEIGKSPFSDIISSYDEPIINGAVFYSHDLMRAIRKYVKVCISGNGADEIFAGYDSYSNLNIPKIPFLNFFSKNPFSNKLFFALNYFSKSYKFRRGFYFRKLAEEKFRNCFTQSFLKEVDFENGKNLINKACQESQPRDFLDAHSYTDLMICHQHGHCRITDMSGMFHNLEVRSPFLNHKIIEFASSIPNNFKIKNKIFSKIRKFILKRNLEKFLPSSIVNAKKLGFGYDFDYTIMNFLDLNKNQNLKKLIKNGEYRSESIFNEDFITSVFCSDKIYDKMLISIIAIWYERCVAKKKIEI